MEKEKEISSTMIVKLKEAGKLAEAHFQDMVDLEFVIENDDLYIVNCNPKAKRTGEATIRIAVDLFLEGIITGKTMLSRIEPSHLNHLLRPSLLTDGLEKIGTGLPASIGTSVGALAFSYDVVNNILNFGRPVIYARHEVNPEDLDAIVRSDGVITTHGGMTSHAAVICRGMGKTCIVGIDGKIDYQNGKLKTESGSINEGECLTIDGYSGDVFKGRGKITKKEWRNDHYILLLFHVINYLASEGEIPANKMGIIWRLRDMLIHGNPYEEMPNHYNPNNSKQIKSQAQRDYLSLENLNKKDRLTILKKIREWKLNINQIGDTKYIWQGLRKCLYRLLMRNIELGHHPLFYRPIFDPLQAIFSYDEFGYSSVNKKYSNIRASVQCVGEEFFGINHFISNFIEIESVRIYAAIICDYPNDFWELDFTNPKGEKLISRSQNLIALKIIVNDAEIPFNMLPEYYNYFRRKEYYWKMYKYKNVARQEIIDFLRDGRYVEERNNEVSEICRRGNLISSNYELTKIGMSLIKIADIKERISSQKLGD